MKPAYLIIGAIIVVLIVGGYFTYNYFVERPPTGLIKLLTRTEPPPPLPAGNKAPLDVPEGFAASIYSREVPGARVMIRDPKGAMLVSLTSSGKVVALPDLDANGEADKTITVLENLKEPHGLLVKCPDTGNASADQDACVLYVAETDALKSYSYDADTFTARYQKTLATFPSGAGHFTRTLLMHPDGKRLLVSIGSSCNVCVESDPRRASVQAIDLATGQMSLFAKGLRNSVFLAMRPGTDEVWATENGRDVIGDDIPPDEINILREGKDYGWPTCYGQNVHDTAFDKKRYEGNPCAGKEAAHIDLQAHSAPLGLAFIPAEGWPADMQRDLLVAFHGSWNRSVPTGYKVVRINLDAQGNAQGVPIDFMAGFLEPGAKTDKAIGRPVGLLAEPGGVLYVSDDRAGAIYRVAPVAGA